MNKNIKDKIEYWLESRISKGSLSLIKIIACITLLIALIITIMLLSLGISDENNIFYTFWDTLAYSINAWMPFAEDADYSAAHLVLIAICSIVGLFVTSSLISVISSALEEKIEAIKNGSTPILETNHIVVIGFIPGEYTLIRQLVVANKDKKTCLVIASSEDKNKMEELIDDNVDYPDNIKIICRSIDICDETELKRCSIDTCQSVIISPMEDQKVIKCLFLLSKILKDNNRENVAVVATVRNKEFILPENFNQDKNLIVLMLDDFIARIISNTCTQPGLSLVYLDLFNEKGSELYIIDNINYINKTYGELLSTVDGGVPLGIINDRQNILCPSYDYILKEDDKLVVFAEDIDSCRILESSTKYNYTNKSISTNKENKKLVILGYNETFPTIISELNQGSYTVDVAGVSEDKKDMAIAQIKGNKNIKILDSNLSIDDINDLEKIIKDADRVFILNNHDKNGEAADIKVMTRITKIRDIRNRLNLNLTIGIELRRAANRTLIGQDDHTDYIVRTNMFSMFLAQLVKNVKLQYVYKDILSKGNKDIKALPAKYFDCLNEMSTRDIRHKVQDYGYVFLGYLSNGDGDYDQCLNPSLEEIHNIKETDTFVVIG